MSKISFEGIGEMVATFACAEDVAAGQVVKITADGTVGTCPLRTVMPPCSWAAW